MSNWPPSCTLEALRVRAALLAEVRSFFAKRGVLEVQTPVLGQHTVSDPAIASWRTATDERYLQTSPEYHMKRLLAAGAPSIYQIGPVFRHGEAGRWHNPEFTMIEWYRLGFNAKQLMDEVAALVDVLLGKGRYRFQRCADLLREQFGLELADVEAERLPSIAAAAGLGGDPSAAAALDWLLAKALNSLDAERVFVTDFPPAMAALARLNDDGSAARFELVVNGQEVANGYYELTDAGELARRIAVDNEVRRQRGLPSIAADANLLAAQRHGLPDCAGVAVGFDRLVALKINADSVSETLAFDWQRA